MSTPGNLDPVDAVTPKELAAACGLSEKTIWRRMELWRRDRGNPLGIPYLLRLGRPYRIPREVAERITSAEAVAEGRA